MAGTDIARFTAYVTALEADGTAAVVIVTARRRGAATTDPPLRFRCDESAAPELHGKLVVTVNSRPDEMD